MALLRDVIFKRGLNAAERLKVEKEKFNLKALNKMIIRFDPFTNGVKNIRTVNFFLHDVSVVSKNQKCVIKTEILNDRSDPTITAEAVNGETFIFKCANLSSLEIFELLNKYLTPLAPVEEELATILSASIGKKKLKK